MNKHDYTYIALFDQASTDAVLGFQDEIRKVLGHSAYTDQWVPHTTVSFGNSLSQEEVEQVGIELADVFKDQKSFKIRIAAVHMRERMVDGRKVGALRLKLSPNADLDALSEKVVSIAKKYEVPFDVFSENHFHIGLGRYELEGLENVNVEEIIHLDPNLEITVTSVALYFSMENDPKPDKASETASISFV
ncbi:MAG: hypothetical protein JWM20_511 [Patescibacteria group bacterium]|nr:hypothetical protein [Patescibacteria group bacterium]